MPSSYQAKIQQSPHSVFQKRVWSAMLRIPRGKVATYQTLARLAGNSKAARAVGNACNANPFAPHVPCHRVIASDGSLGGYAHGLPKKKSILSKEGVRWNQNEIIDLDKFGFNPRA